MQDASTGPFLPLDLTQAAREFAAEVGGTAEREKKPIPSPPGLQMFFLYIRAQGYVPPHHVPEPIAVQTILGEARFSAQGQSYALPQGSVVFLAADVPHELFASTESVLLVTRALRD